MIVKSMTPEEVYKELERDLPNVQRWWLGVYKRIERLALKLTKFPRSKWHEYKSHRFNRYLVYTIVMGRRYGIFTVPLVLQKADRGYTVYVVRTESEATNRRAVILPHVFDRYAQRVGVKKEGVELIKHFIEKNFHGEISDNERLVGRSVRYKGRDNITFLTAEGVMLGEMMSGGLANGIFVAHTFITYDMATGLQREEFERRRGTMLTDEEALYDITN